MPPPNRASELRAAISLILSVIASLLSLGGIAYAAGSLTNRVDTLERQQADMRSLPMDIAVMKRDVAWLVEAQKRRDDRNADK